MPLRPIDPIARQFGGKSAQAQSGNYAIGGGSANAYTFALKPPVSNPVVGMPVRVKIPATNTGASTLNGVAIKHLDGTDAVAGELVGGRIYEFVYNGSVYQLQTETVSPYAVQAQVGNYATDTGTQNAYVVALTPAIASNVVGMPIRVKITNTCNGASTLNAGAGVVPIKNNDNTDIESGQLIAGGVYEFIFDGTVYRLMGGQIFEMPPQGSEPPNPSIGQFYFDTTLGYPRIWNGTSWNGFLLS